MIILLFSKLHTKMHPTSILYMSALASFPGSPTLEHKHWTSAGEPAWERSQCTPFCPTTESLWWEKTALEICIGQGLGLGKWTRFLVPLTLSLLTTYSSRDFLANVMLRMHSICLQIIIKPLLCVLSMLQQINVVHEYKADKAAVSIVGVWMWFKLDDNISQ